MRGVEASRGVPGAEPAGLGEACSADAPCAEGLVCRDGFCGPECVVDADCGPNELCTDGQCKTI